MLFQIVSFLCLWFKIGELIVPSVAQSNNNTNEMAIKKCGPAEKKLNAPLPQLPADDQNLNLRGHASGLTMLAFYLPESIEL